ncbi:hypothetical protein QR680_007478 [Steinernema hermaphroditum]|uniref:ShKT domain-containing protein n=1 Tax=Steinernema hermaphroditum TaxID=289476 RepID=A0AA39ID97_9BILA|nr:hypothetical protein QR680_007478 [Steinernema hermaphroditum]
MRAKILRFLLLSILLVGLVSTTTPGIRACNTDSECQSLPLKDPNCHNKCFTWFTPFGRFGVCNVECGN